MVITGLQCPGCGSQRAVHSLLHADLRAAWGYNALLVAFLPFVLLLCVAEWQRMRWPLLYNGLHRPVVIRACFLIVCLWAVGRNLMG
ncbi:MAG: DUF2752 domain-containing protein [Clostridium sp.]|nr:DUF2752 domain-containing protein [Clostridium sp.]